MVKDIQQYISAATRDHTRRSYQGAVQHFEVEWGGLLPATADSIARYLVDYAETLSVNTLKQRLAALAQWHHDQGFPDPTKSPLVKKVLKGIRELHPVQEKRAKPLQLTQLEHLVAWLDKAIQGAVTLEQELRHTRDKALVLIGFWRGFRSDELCRLAIEHIQVQPGTGMTLFLPRSKGDRKRQGTTCKAPALSRLCPVQAYQDWLQVSELREGPVFRSIDRWGRLAAEPLHSNSIIPLLRRLFAKADLPEPERYSSHSLRRGFATWANDNGWDVKMLMEYVGWKDVKSAMRYIDAADPFARQRIEAALPAAKEVATLARNSLPQQSCLELELTVEGRSKFVRGMKQTREAIETLCLARHAMERLDFDGGHYRIRMSHGTPEELERLVQDLLQEMHELAEERHCVLEARIWDVQTGQVWD